MSPLGAFARAMCYRTGRPTLELLLYHSAEDRSVKRPQMMTAMPCAADPTLKLLDGLSLTMAEGSNFDVVTAASNALTPQTLAELNSETVRVAGEVGLHLGHATFHCAG